MFCCQSFDDVSPYVCTYSFFSSVWIAEWPSFGKELLTQLTICSLCILTIGNFNYFPFRFLGRNLHWVLIAQVPGHCILVTFATIKVTVGTL